jgi:hypothetical protein
VCWKGIEEEHGCDCVIYTVEGMKRRERCFAWNEKMKIGGEGKGLFGSFGF